MQRYLKIPVYIFAALLCCVLTGCPDNESDVEEINFKTGTWAGSVVTTARLILRQEPEYWCSAWKIEAVDIRIDEFQDGSLEGYVNGNFFQWSVNDSRLLDYSSIAAGQWDKYTTFTLELTGHVDENGYTLEVVELPISLPDPTSPTGRIEFWDFLYPSILQGEFPDDGVRIMSGESIRAQGNDYRETSGHPDYREFSINYVWEIKKL